MTDLKSDVITFNVAKGSDISPAQLKEAGATFKDFKYSIPRDNLTNLSGFDINDISTSSTPTLEFKKHSYTLSPQSKPQVNVSDEQRHISSDNSEKVIFTVAKGSDISPAQLKEAGATFKDFKYSISKTNLDNLKGFNVNETSSDFPPTLKFTSAATLKETETFDFRYKYDQSHAKLAIRINDKLVPDSNIDQSLLAKIAQKDNFLKTVPFKDIQSGFVSLLNTSVQPKAQIYDQSASLVKTASTVQSASKTLTL